MTTIKNTNFKSEVLDETKPVLIDFFANWCTPCKMLSPVIEEIAKEKPEVKVCKINIDEEPELAQQFQIMSIPTLVVMKNGKQEGKLVGVRPKKDIVNLLNV